MQARRGGVEPDIGRKLFLGKGLRDPLGRVVDHTPPLVLLEEVQRRLLPSLPGCRQLPEGGNLAGSGSAAKTSEGSAETFALTPPSIGVSP